jgi:hypothetical protein
MSSQLRLFVVTLACLLFIRAGAPSAEQVAVRHVEGLVHGFLSLRSPEGKLLANGDLIQNAHGDRVTSRLVYHFEDGSLDDETCVFAQRGYFSLLTDHHVQKGPAFKVPIDMTIDVANGHVVVKYKDDEGANKVEDEHMKLPPDLANGVLIALLKNIRPDALPKSLSLIAPTPKPRLVRLILSVAGSDPFMTAGAGQKATHYVVKVDIGGITGIVAELVGKVPPDSHVWITQGEAPAFVKSQSPMFMGAPLWQTELVSPIWPADR